LLRRRSGRYLNIVWILGHDGELLIAKSESKLTKRVSECGVCRDLLSTCEASLRAHGLLREAIFIMLGT
jgi:hypothetical protein